MSKHTAHGVGVVKPRLMLGALLLLAVAVPGQASIVVYSSDFIVDSTRTHFNGFESMPAVGDYFTGGGGPYTEDTIQVRQVNPGPNPMWVTGTPGWNGFQGRYSWYSTGDHGYTQLSLAGGADFWDVGFNYATGFHPDYDKDILFELLDDGTVVLSGTARITAYHGYSINRNPSGPDYLGFSGGGFDTIRMRDGSPGVAGATVTVPTWQGLAIDNIELSGGTPSTPELSTWMLLACSGLAGFVLRRRKT